MNWIADHSTDPRLLPRELRTSDNSRRINHYKRALSKAMDRCLNPQQREQVILRYWHGFSKSKIARVQGTSCSAVCKSLQTAELAIKEYIELYMQIYDLLEREFLREAI